MRTDFVKKKIMLLNILEAIYRINYHTMNKYFGKSAAKKVSVPTVSQNCHFDNQSVLLLILKNQMVENFHEQNIQTGYIKFCLVHSFKVLFRILIELFHKI